MTSLPFDSDDAPPGYIALPYEAAGGCSNCAFRNDDCCVTAPCMAAERDDGQPAIFQLRKKQNTVLHDDDITELKAFLQH